MISELIKKACDCVGSQAELARQLGLSSVTIHQWRVQIRPVPIERCTAIEQVTNGAVTRKDLRPDDWERIWPELATPECLKRDAA